MIHPLERAHRSLVLRAIGFCRSRWLPAAPLDAREKLAGATTQRRWLLSVRSSSNFDGKGYLSIGFIGHQPAPGD
jgi:hypothetical protein